MNFIITNDKTRSYLRPRVYYPWHSGSGSRRAEVPSIQDVFSRTWAELSRNQPTGFLAYMSVGDCLNLEHSEDEVHYHER